MVSNTNMPEFQKQRRDQFGVEDDEGTSQNDPVSQNQENAKLVGVEWKQRTKENTAIVDGENYMSSAGAEVSHHIHDMCSYTVSASVV
jgi:hypothetical protein